MGLLITKQKSWDVTSLSVVDGGEKVSHNFDKQYDNNLLDMFELSTNVFSHHAFLYWCLGILNNE